MAKFNAVVLTAADGTQVHFVTRGKAKSPTMDEVVEYMNENNIVLVDLEKEERDKSWAPPNKRVFLIDLRSGLEFCSQKYGVSEDTVQNYIKSAAPHINTNVYRGHNA